jgi:hypothetical protein
VVRFSQLVEVGELPAEPQRLAAYNILRRYHPELVREIRTAIEGSESSSERETVASLVVGAVLHVCGAEDGA